MTNISNITGKYEQAYLNEAANKQEVAPDASSTDTVETESPRDDRVSLSDASRELQAAEDAVAATPDVRQGKVDAIRQAVKSGRYEIDAGKIADSMLGRNVNETM